MGLVCDLNGLLQIMSSFVASMSINSFCRKRSISRAVNVCPVIWVQFTVESLSIQSRPLPGKYNTAICLHQRMCQTPDGPPCFSPAEGSVPKWPD